jgi:aspartyl-tRNA(Asn)/glutamyl-tRNA(Gln) amidotransferase subunit A
MNLLDMTATELAKAIKEGRTTAIAAAEEVVKQIELKEKEYNCYITFDKDAFLNEAMRVQAGIEDGSITGALAGVPVAVKDNICTDGVRTTAASKILENFIPAYSAEAVTRLRDAGAVIIGKTNMDEFAMGSTSETSAYGITRNPHNTDHVPGGSSGGSAAAVAASECYFALGSDTGGSIRQPASYCGVVGMKPTYGSVSRYGLIAYASSLDQIGPICKDVTDCATVMEILTSYDEKDSTSVRREDVKFTEALVADVKGMKVGVPKN